MGKFTDGIKDVLSGLINRRNSLARSQVSHRSLSDDELRVMYKTGLMSKIIRLKAGYSLNDTLQFDSKENKEVYNKRLAKHVKKATKFMLGFGRGVIVVFKDGDDLSKALDNNVDPKSLKIRVFSGDIAKGNNPNMDLRSERYYKPKTYNIKGHVVHWTRVIDFTYYQPSEDELPNYEYGGLSESELIYEQFVNDAVVQRASGSIIEKASTFVYKIKGYKQLIQSKRESDVVQYVSTCEDGRSIYGGLITDAEDMVEVLSQSLTDIDKVDNITLRRIAMVTGLGMTVLIGEQASGLNASGEKERQGFQDTIENLQSDYLEEPLQRLSEVFNLGCIEFKENQGQSALERVEYDTKAVAVAKTLWEIGEDYGSYLQDKDVIQKDDWESYWAKKDEEPEIDDSLSLEELFNGGSENTDPIKNRRTGA